MINDRGIWLSHEETNTHEYDEKLGDALVKMFSHLESVVDIGCGNGRYTWNFLNHRIPCKGYDGSPLTQELTGGLGETADFSEPIDIGKFDLVLSLEVGEHIPTKYESVFLDNLVSASKRLIVLSWATKGQFGIGHVNCRSNTYIIKKLKKRGFYFIPALTAILRYESTLPWFQNTLMVFMK